MLPHDPTKFIQFLDPADFIPSEQTADPGFTQLVNDVLGNAGTNTDGFDGVFSETAGLVDAWDKALGEQDAALDAVLTSLSATNPGSLDNSLAGYANSFAAGNAIVKAGQLLHTPDLLELPIDPGFGGGIGAPPAQVPIDLGQLALGAAAIDYLLGTRTPTKPGYRGLTQIQMVSGDPSIFTILSARTPVVFGDRFGNEWTDYEVTYRLHVTPAAVGTWLAQFNMAGFQGHAYSIVTFTVAVIP